MKSLEPNPFLHDCLDWVSRSKANRVRNTGRRRVLHLTTNLCLEGNSSAGAIHEDGSDGWGGGEGWQDPIEEAQEVRCIQSCVVDPIINRRLRIQADLDRNNRYVIF